MNNFSIRSNGTYGSDLFGSLPVSRQRKGRLLGGVAAIACAFTLGFFALNVAAADVASAESSTKVKAPITVILKQFKVLNDEHGNAKLVDVKAVLPGDVLEYRAVYSNRGSAALPVVATLPIPESLEYVKESASASTDLVHTVALKDSQYSKEPLMQKVVTASGATLSQPLPYASYRYVRWDLGNLSPGKSVEVSVRAKVAQNPVVDASAEDKAPTLSSFLSTNK
jgi:uncharacterized repeat protein (TIGR01451 family)